jgi:carbon-monoxide dehydrogenase medium subunit
MHSFNFHRPANIKAAATLYAKQKDARLLAGGHTLIPSLKLRLASFENIIDLKAIKGLDKIELKGKNLLIGALAVHNAVATSATVKKAIPALAKLAGMIGDPAVRNRGTLGGSIANNDPAADYPAALVGLDATVITNKRKIPADKFFKGLFETALGKGEVVLQVSFPLPKKAGYEKFRHPASRFALVGVFVADTGKEVRVAVTGASESGVFRAKDMETALKKSGFKPESIANVKISENGLNSDIHAAADYRAHLVGVMAKRAIAGAA